MIIRGMLEISGILQENYYQAVGSPHPALPKARPWDLTHVQLRGRREEVQCNNQAAHTGEISDPLLLGCTIQDKKMCSFIVQTTANATLFFEN